MQIKSEDWLFDHIMVSIDKDASKFELLEFIYFKMLDSSSMKRFAQLDFEYVSRLNGQIWRRIGRHLVVELSNDSREYGSRCHKLSDRYIEGSHRFNPNAPFNDIISYLISKHGGNVYDLGIVSLAQSSEYEYDSYPAKNCVDLNSSSFSLTSR
jgi:hypothetical protein